MKDGRREEAGEEEKLKRGDTAAGGFHVSLGRKRNETDLISRGKTTPLTLHRADGEMFVVFFVLKILEENDQTRQAATVINPETGALHVLESYKHYLRSDNVK